MKKFRTHILAAILVTTTSASLMSCKKDNIDVTIITPLAGDYVGADVEDGSLYITRTYNMANKSDSLFIVNIGNLGLTNKFQVNGNNISIPPTHYDYHASSTVVYSGDLSATGKIDGNILTLKYTITGPEEFLGPSMTYTANFTGDREFKAPIVQGH